MNSSAITLLFLAMCFSHTGMGEPKGGPHSVPLDAKISPDFPVDPVGDAIVKCRKAFSETGLWEGDDNDIFPGRPEMGFELGGCIYSSYGVYQVSSTDSRSEGSVLRNLTCTIELPYTGHQFISTLRTSSKGAFPELRRQVRWAFPSERTDLATKCPLARAELNPKDKIRPVLKEPAGDCIQALGRYFDGSVGVGIGSSLNYAKRVLDGTWNGERPNEAALGKIKTFIRLC